MRFWLFLLFPLYLSAQTHRWQEITIADGLSQGMIYDLLQDRQGFLWFATKDGLNRYDGYNFKVFTHDAYNPFSLSGNTCTALLEDSKGRIWVGTSQNGLNLYEPQAHRFYHADIVDKQLTNAGNYGIAYLREDKTGAIWVITGQAGKLFKIIPDRLYPPQNDFSDWVQPVSADASSKRKPNPDFVSDKTAMEFRYTETLYPFAAEFSPANRLAIDLSGTNVLRDAEKRFWIVGNGELICAKENFTKKITFATPQNQRKVINIFQDGRIAICNQEYVWFFKADELLQMKELTPQNAFAQLPPNKDIINQLFKDRNGNIWVATGGYGLLKINPRIHRFQSFLPQYSPSSLHQDRQGRVYIHSNYRPSFHFYFLDKPSNKLLPIPNVTYEPTHGHDALLQDDENHFWLLGRTAPHVSRSLKKYSVDWQLQKEYPLPPLNELKSGSFRLLKDREDNIWIGHTEGNLLKFNPKTEQFQGFSYQSLLPKSGSAVETFALYQDGQQTLWIGTQKGLIKADHPNTTPVFSLYTNLKTDRRSLSENFVSGMTDDPLLPDQYLWVSTKGGGLDRLDKRLGTFEHFTEAQGLPNKVVYGIVTGEDKNLWMSTNRGIARLNPKSLTFTNFNKSDGLQDDEFNTNSYFRSPSGELLFGGVNGITIFRPSAISGNSKPPVVKLIGLKVNNKPVEVGDESGILDKAMEFLPPLQLAHDENQVSLEFGVMDFTNPVKNRYRYQLEGIDADWVEAGTTRFANFSQLPSGRYTFRVQGSTNGEVWSQPIELKLTVNPPFYRTWWAYLLYLSFISYLIYRLYQNQLNRVRLQEQIRFKDKETERLAELDQLKTQFFTNISHEFRTPLTLILGPMEQMRQEYARDSRLPMMQRNAQRLLELINQLLDLGKLDAREMQVHLQPGDLARFIQLLGSSFQSLAESRNITFTLRQNQQKVLARFDADKIEKILINLLSNAFKFTEDGGKIELSVEYSPP
ncbi:MAG: two-component regulator propeller domain-containing protein, partial [Spirosomataceae bacterium]